jgi:hypothetical protein
MAYNKFFVVKRFNFYQKQISAKLRGNHEQTKNLGLRFLKKVMTRLCETDPSKTEKFLR